MNKIGIIASAQIPEAFNAKDALLEKYQFVSLNDEPDAITDMDVIVALGGDGFMLHALHEYLDYEIPIYGMNCGTVGFLLNGYEVDGLIERLANAKPTEIRALKMDAQKHDGTVVSYPAINEVSLMRGSRQAAKFSITIDGITHMEEMVSDGVVVATPAGSSAYNYSVGGPIIPLKANLFALTPISPFRPRRWKGALLPSKVTIEFDMHELDKRPVNAVADFLEVENIVKVTISLHPEKHATLLFDPGHTLEERILKEQFLSG